ncbi:MAG: hypothetical protein NXI31_07950 [bacterium]|nr:hypothetical protein [bacterium]
MPDVLNAVPQTGLPSYPSFEMLPIRDGATRDSWGIVVRCPIGVSSSDMFVYWPSEMYPDSIDGGRVRRIGRWAYVAGM